MLIYDRRRCRPPQAEETRRRLTLSQRARLGLLEKDGWQLLFVRGEPSSAFLAHEQEGYGMLGRDGRLIAIRALPLRGAEGEEAIPAQRAVAATGDDLTSARPTAA